MSVPPASAVLAVVDLVAILTLVFGVYYPRHRRSDLVVAFLGVNIGVLAVSEVLGSSAVGAGLGLGLFGVLSIIRLRSSEISQREVAYYFAALALGLIGGLATEVNVLTVGLFIALPAVLALADSRLVGGGVHTVEIQLDAAVGDPDDLPAEIAARTGAEVVGVTVRRIDYVNDTTTVTASVRGVGTAGRSRGSAAPATPATAAATASASPVSPAGVL